MQLTYPLKKTETEILNLAAAPLQNLDNTLPILFQGDNFTVLSILLNNGYRGKIDLIYIDPPYNTQQQFTVTENRISTISRSKKGVTAYHDHWTTEEYLEFMRERLVLMRELLSEQGSIYVHIDSKMGHYLKIIMDEIFDIENFKNDIARIKSNPKNFSRRAYGNEKDMVLFYAKNAKKNIFNQITVPLSETEKKEMFQKVGIDGRRYNTVPAHAPGETQNGDTGKPWRNIMPPQGRHWRCSPTELETLDNQGLIEWSKNGVPRIKKYADEHKGKKMQDVWRYKDPQYPNYPTEKNAEMLEMIIAQSSNPDSIILDCFSGGGSTLLAAQSLQRRWIGSDISPVAMKTIQTRLGITPYQFINLP
ncbi:site-specific DNA-methyltransferase [Neisseria sp. ZJ106]|uniref:site-specific DNA-methyltransferase (adenine-specific) n=1 Tax=Neisseria lisongii TaxID=2912188 RepID=A0ABY7RMW4_9NEIS|nr:DNA methyltransferase [Neisseria lisongii]MCF7521307.1 site-specific DNA-methyltransferase [Neisseria lisongii]WCL72111.1 DNA methyltransferase [Neisseria lisongii]